MNGTRKEPTARAKERAALPAGKAQRERGTFVRIIGEVDRPFLLIVIALLCIGSVMVFSASYAYGKFYFNDSYYFARRQLGWAVLGLAGMCFTAVFVDYRWIKRFAWLGYGVALLLNAAVVVMGLTLQVSLQAILNIAVVTNTLPSTGISLPFFSYGGTSLVILMVEMGVILSISRYSYIERG